MIQHPIPLVTVVVSIWQVDEKCLLPRMIAYHRDFLHVTLDFDCGLPQVGPNQLKWQLVPKDPDKRNGSNDEKARACEQVKFEHAGNCKPYTNFRVKGEIQALSMVQN